VPLGAGSLLLCASLLQLRGISASTCPLQDGQGNVLCFNGEVFGGLHVPPGSNDARLLLAALAAAQEQGALCRGPPSRPPGGSGSRPTRLRGGTTPAAAT
jgi:hypothetical protein